MAEADDVCHPVAVHIRKLARVLIVVHPAAGADSELGKLEGGLRKVSVAGGESDKHTSIAKADDVGHMVPVHVRKLAGISVLTAPSAGVRAKVAKLVGGLREGPRIIIDD